MIATALKPIRKRRQTRARRCTFKNAYTRFFARVQYGPNLYAGFFAQKMAIDPYGFYWGPYAPPEDVSYHPNQAAQLLRRFREIRDHLNNFSCNPAWTSKEQCYREAARQTQRAKNAIDGFAASSLESYNDLREYQQLDQAFAAARRQFITHAIMSVATLGCTQLALAATASFYTEYAAVATLVAHGTVQTATVVISYSGSRVSLNGMDRETANFVVRLVGQQNTLLTQLGMAQAKARSKCNACFCEPCGLQE